MYGILSSNGEEMITIIHSLFSHETETDGDLVVSELLSVVLGQESGGGRDEEEVVAGPRLEQDVEERLDA